jgi:hypothetical protein
MFGIICFYLSKSVLLSQPVVYGQRERVNHCSSRRPYGSLLLIIHHQPVLIQDPYTEEQALRATKVAAQGMRLDQNEHMPSMIHMLFDAISKCA